MGIYYKDNTDEYVRVIKIEGDIADYFEPWEIFDKTPMYVPATQEEYVDYLVRMHTIDAQYIRDGEGGNWTGYRNLEACEYKCRIAKRTREFIDKSMPF